MTLKKTLTTLTILILSLGCFAQPEVFDIATYKIPKGYTKTGNNGGVNYTTSNETTKSFCLINLYASSSTNGTAKDEFEKSWKKFAATPFIIKDAPTTDTTSDDEGREVIFGTGNFKSGSLEVGALLYTFAGFGRTTVILFLTNGESYQKDIEDFLTSLELNKNPKTFELSNNRVVPANTSPSTKTNSVKPSNNLEGVWMTLHLRKVYLDKEPTGNLKWITFFSNGRVTKVIPDEGMNNYDRDDPRIGYYQFSNGTASLQWFKEVKPFPITFINESQITFQELYSNDTYFRCIPVDGLKLQGTWTSFDNVNDPELNDNSKNRSMITFGKDGTFTDYGVFVRDLFTPVPAGSGTYTIGNFTLILHYNNGTLHQTAFTGSLSLNPATNNQLIYIHRSAFLKRN